jgi:hypothetical protein
VPFTEDALANADLYLRVLNLVLTLIVSAFMFYAGKAAYRITKNMSYSILLQFTPLFTSIIFGNIGRVTPENLIPIPVMVLSLLLLKIFYEEEETENSRQAIGFALTGAFGLSIKLTILPILVIPFIVLHKWKNRIVYVIAATLSFFAMALPMTLQFKIFFGWVKDLFMHSGNYGKGDSNIINWETVIPNFKYLWTENQYYFYVIILLFIGLTVSFFIKGTDKKRQAQRIGIALLTSIGIQVAMVCKHFEYRYFYAAIMLLPVSFIFALELIRPVHVRISKFRISEIVVLLFIAFFFSKNLPVIYSLSHHLDNEKLKKMPAVYYMNSIEKNAIKFIAPWQYGCPTPEYSMMFSYGWAGRQRDYYKPFLAKLYPDTYIYYPWDKTVNYWGNAPDVKNTDRPVYIFLENDNLKEVFFNDMKDYFPDRYELTKTFFNDLSSEVVYRLTKLPSE